MILFLSYVVLIFDTLFVTCVNNILSGNLVVIFEMFIVLLLLCCSMDEKGEQKRKHNRNFLFFGAVFSRCVHCLYSTAGISLVELGFPIGGLKCL